jgi:hypothetical protein
VTIQGGRISGNAKLDGFEVVDPMTCKVDHKESSQSGKINGKVDRGTNPPTGRGTFTFRFPQQTSQFQWSGKVTAGGITDGEIIVNGLVVGQFELMKGP